MAAGGSDSGESSWWGNDSNQWFSSVLSAAKEKSAAAMQQMSKDLQEFGSTIQKDTTQAVASSATAIGQNLKPEEGQSPDQVEKSTTDQLRDGFLSFLSTVSQNLAAPEDVQGDEYVVHPRDTHLFDQAKARLHAMQVDPATYCNEPDEPLDAYHRWMESFSVESMKGDISELLVANSQVRSIYTKLVPAAVSHAEFWGRYFYKIHKLDQDEARRSALKERAEMTSSQTPEEDLGWGDEDDSWDTVPEAVKGIPSTDRSRREKAPVSDGHPTQQGVTESSSAKESPHRTRPDDDVSDGNDETDDDGIENGNAAAADVTSPRADAGDEDGAGLAEGVRQLTLDAVQKGQDEVKENPSPAESSNGSSGNKDSSLSDEWEQDFDDIEITEEDIKNAAQLASKGKPLDGDEEDLDEWENWE